MYSFIDKELNILLISQRKKLLQDFYVNVDMLQDLLRDFENDESLEFFESSLRKVTVKLNNSSLLFNTLYYESQDERKYSKELQKDLKEICFKFSNSLMKMKAAFGNEELKRVYQFYLDILRNPLTEEPKKLSFRVKINKSSEEKNLTSDVEEKIQNFLSINAKSYSDFDKCLNIILIKLELQISSFLIPDKSSYDYVPRVFPLKDYAKRTMIISSKDENISQSETNFDYQEILDEIQNSINE